jgi:RNA exonuclease 4
MVGVGYKGSESTVARVSIVNYHGHVLLDTFVQPKESVTDFRTWISGVREEDLRGAPDFEEVQSNVNTIVDGRVLVGHAISNDLNVGPDILGEFSSSLGSTSIPSTAHDPRYTAL